MRQPIWMRISPKSSVHRIAQTAPQPLAFPPSKSLSAGSWPGAGLCPKNNESAGKRRSNRMRKGAPWLKTTLIQCAWAATRAKGSYLQAQYFRLRSRRGPKKAVGAVAASILTAAYHMLKNGTLYQDLGASHFDNRDKGKQVLRLVNRLKNLGFDVQITSIAA